MTVQRMRWGKTIAYATATILLTHGLAFTLIRALPDAAISALGIDSSNELVVTAFKQAHGDRSYLDTFLSLGRLELGSTLDGVPVGAELRSALLASLPRGVLAAAITLTLAFAAPVYTRRLELLEKGAIPFFAFLPAYVLPFVMLGAVSVVALAFASQPSTTILDCLISLTLAAPATALAVTQSSRVMRRMLGADYARTLLALGASRLSQRRILAFNLAYEMTPSLQKICVSLLGVALFVEPIFGVPGIGTTAMRAIRRSDTDLLLGVVLVLAVMTTLIGVASQYLRIRLERIG